MEQAESESDDFYVIIVGDLENEYLIEDNTCLEEDLLGDFREFRKLWCGEDDNLVEVKKPFEVKTKPLEANIEHSEAKLEKEEVDAKPPDDQGYRARVMEYVHAIEARAKAAPPPLPHIPYRKVEGQHKCMYCPHVTPNEKNAVRHYRFRHGKRYHKCLGCNSGYRRHDTMLFHEAYCQAENANLVRMAREIYTSKNKLPPMPKSERRSMKMPCKICGKLISRGNMKLHLDVHSVEKKFSCPHCTAKFRTNRARSAHVNAHSGFRPYRCDECPKAYTSDTALRAHKLDHGESLYACEYCERRYKRKHTLKQHLATHADGNEYLCNECGKVMHSKMAMEQHKRAHRGELPRFTCLDCGKSYSKMTGLNFHMKGKHGRQIITRKMFFNKLPTMVDVSEFMENLDSKCPEQADDPDDISNGSIGDTDAVDNEDVYVDSPNATNEVD